MAGRYSVMLLLDRTQASVVRAALVEFEDKLLEHDLDAFYAVLTDLSKKMHEENKRIIP